VPGRLVKGSTRPLVEMSATRGRIGSMLEQLDENNREIEMQRLEIRRLREQVQLLCQHLSPADAQALRNSLIHARAGPGGLSQTPAPLPLPPAGGAGVDLAASQSELSLKGLPPVGDFGSASAPNLHAVEGKAAGIAVERKEAVEENKEDAAIMEATA
jgi:hypothetical protein